MMDSRPNPGGDAVIASIEPTLPTLPALRPERVSVRRRRARRVHRLGQVALARTRKRWIWTVALCTGVLLLMALGLYWGLSRQEAAPSEAASHGALRVPALS
jgi:hypothetical protein